MTLERTNEKVEQDTEPTPEAEQVEEPTPAGSDETPSETTPETYSKEKTAELISAAEAAVQSAKDIELAAERRKHREAMRAIKAEQEDARLKLLEQTEQERYGETDAELLKELHELRRAVHRTASDTSDIQALGYAYKFSKQYGVDVEPLLDSGSKEEMEVKAKELSQATKAEAEKATAEKIRKLEEELAQAKKAPQKIDSSAPGVAGVGWRELTPEEKLRRGLKK